MTSAQPGDTAPDATGADDGQPDTLPLALTHGQMNAAYDTGQAIPLASAVTWLTRYRDAWWVVYECGWLRITDTSTTEELDQAAARLTEAGDRDGPEYLADTPTRSRASEQDRDR